MASHSASSVLQHQVLSHYQVQWGPFPYQPPQVFPHAVLMPYISEVSKWRPLVSSTRLVDAMDQLMDVKRLGTVADTTIEQATKEILHIAKIFCERWNQLPSLRKQLGCTATKRNIHVRQFWTIAVVSMVLSGNRFCYYEENEEAITVHDVRGVQRSSGWAKVPLFYLQLRSLPPLEPLQTQQPSSEQGPEVGASERRAPVTDKHDKPQSWHTQREDDFAGGITTDTNDAPFEMMLKDLHVPPELRCRPNEDMFWTMLA